MSGANDLLQISVVRFTEEVAALTAIRTAVFMEEQSIPREIELDDRDAVCLHLLATFDGQPVGTARLDLERDGKVGRVAVLPAFRRRGIGRALMQTLTDLAALHGCAVWFHAQESAMPFYRSIGYQPEGARFEEAGIPHYRMVAVP